MKGDHSFRIAIVILRYYRSIVHTLHFAHRVSKPFIRSNCFILSFKCCNDLIVKIWGKLELNFSDDCRKCLVTHLSLRYWMRRWHWWLPHPGWSWSSDGETEAGELLPGGEKVIKTSFQILTECYQPGGGHDNNYHTQVWSLHSRQQDLWLTLTMITMSILPSRMSMKTSLKLMK